MVYRFAEPTDFSAIAEYVTATNYFLPVKPETLGGCWIVAEKDNELYGTIWFFAGQEHAYVDYLTADNSRIAARLILAGMDWAKEQKIRYIHGVVASENENVLRFLSEGFGMVSAKPYHRVFKEI